MSYMPLTWWWWGADGVGTDPLVSIVPGATLVLVEPTPRYSPDMLREMQSALVQQDAQTHKRTGDMYHPFSMTVRHRTIYPWVALSANDATPSVARGRNFKTANTQQTQVTTFDDGVDGQEITIRVDDSFTTFDFTESGLVGNGSVNHSASNGDQVHAKYDAAEGVWYCTVVEA